jgi:hypothetical protein
MKSSFPDVIAHSVIQGIIVMFWSHNIFQRNEFSRDIKRLSINFPETDQNVFYLILFSRLSNSKFEDNPQLAIRKMKRNNLWMGLKKPEFNADEIKKILEFLYP